MNERSDRRRDTRRKPSPSGAVQCDLPRVVEIGDRLEGECARWFDRGLGYGFIAVRSCNDFFVSARALLNAPDLRRGDRVTFDVAMDGLGRFQAANVELVDGARITPMTVRSETFPSAIWEDA